MARCQSLTASGSQCKSNKAQSNGHCNRHQGEPTKTKGSKSKKAEKPRKKRVQAVDSPVTPSIKAVSEALELVNGLISTKQMYQVFKAAKQAASSAEIDFPYTWATQKRNMARIIRHIPRSVGSEALDAAFKAGNRGPSLELIRKFGVQDQQATEPVEVDVSQRQALPKTVNGKVSSQTDKRIDKLEGLMAQLLEKLS